MQSACRAASLPFHETNFLCLRRGPYVIAAGLDESLPDTPHTLSGPFVDLFDAALPVLDSVTLEPGRRFLLLSLAHTAEDRTLLAAACKTRGAEKTPGGGFRFHAAGPEGTEAAVRLKLAGAPKSVTVDHQPLPPAAQEWDAATQTLLLRFSNAAAGQWVSIS